MSRTPLAWCNLCQEKLRTLVAISGVAFSLTLVFMQIGFLASVNNTATLFLDQLDFDVAVVSPQYVTFSQSGGFPRIRLDEAHSVPGVERAAPLYVGLQMWHSRHHALNPKEAGAKHPILVLGFDVEHAPFRLDNNDASFPIRVDADQLAQLSTADTVLLDRRSGPNFTPRGPGLWAEIGGRRVKIADLFTLGTGFDSDGTILVSDATFSRLLGGYPLDRVSLGLLRLTREAAGSAEQTEAVVRRIRERLVYDAPAGSPAGKQDVKVLTRDELLGRERAYWVWKKSIGLIFLFGVVVALVVALVVVHQVLSSDIAEHFREYATLKAIGYTDWYIGRVVVEEALMFAVLGYVPAFAASWLLYLGLRVRVNVPVLMTPWIALGVLAASLAVCTVAALLSVRKVASSDPASLF